RVADAPGHHRPAGVNERALDELALERLDRAGHLPALADADDQLLVDLSRGDLVDHAADTERVDANLVEQLCLVHALDEVDSLDDVIAHVVDDREVAFALELLQLRRDVLAQFEHGAVTPRVRPVQPVAGVAISSSHRQAEQVIKSAAVDADADDFAPLQQILERQARLALLLPELRAGPCCVAQRYADLDVQVL